MVAALQASADALPPDDPPDRRAMIERTAHGLATLAPAPRDAMMKAPAVALLGPGVPDLGVGDKAPLAEAVETPFSLALPSTGTIRRDTDSDGARHYSRDLVTSPRPPRSSPPACARGRPRPSRRSGYSSTSRRRDRASAYL